MRRHADYLQRVSLFGGTVEWDGVLWKVKSSNTAASFSEEDLEIARQILRGKPQPIWVPGPKGSPTRNAFGPEIAQKIFEGLPLNHRLRSESAPGILASELARSEYQSDLIAKARDSADAFQELATHSSGELIS